jgi:hypothetical protein
MINPKPNDVLHLCQLITGDRFYFINDKTKTVWELRFHTLVNTRRGVTKLSQCKIDTGKSQRFDANRVVVFLRRTKPIVKRSFHFCIDRYFA